MDATLRHMQWACSLVICLFLGLLSVDGCSTHERWRPQSMEERLFQSQIVVYGRDIEHVDILERHQRTDSNFHVYCVFKSGNRQIREHIRIQRIQPRELCSKTHTKIGQEYILGLKGLGNDNYEWHEVNPMQSAAFPASKRNLDAARRVCGLTNVKLPIGRNSSAVPACPAPLDTSIACTAGTNMASTNTPCLLPWLLLASSLAALLLYPYQH